MIDLVIEQILKQSVDPLMESSETWRERHESDDH